MNDRRPIEIWVCAECGGEDVIAKTVVYTAMNSDKEIANSDHLGTQCWECDSEDCAVWIECKGRS